MVMSGMDQPAARIPTEFRNLVLKAEQPPIDAVVLSGIATRRPSPMSAIQRLPREIHESLSVRAISESAFYAKLPPSYRAFAHPARSRDGN